MVIVVISYRSWLAPLAVQFPITFWGREKSRMSDKITGKGITLRIIIIINNNNNNNNNNNSSN